MKAIQCKISLLVIPGIDAVLHTTFDGRKFSFRQTLVILVASVVWILPPQVLKRVKIFLLSDELGIINGTAYKTFLSLLS